jgi:hypothetical protein
MPADARVAFEPRKTPIQARSTVMVEAISEATIQVVLSHGAERLTTTRVAERAGVSVRHPVSVLPEQAVAAIRGVGTSYE